MEMRLREEVDDGALNKDDTEVGLTTDVKKEKQQDGEDDRA